MINIRNINSLALTNLQPLRLFFFLLSIPESVNRNHRGVIHHPNQGCSRAVTRLRTFPRPQFAAALFTKSKMHLDGHSYKVL